MLVSCWWKLFIIDDLEHDQLGLNDLDSKNTT